MAITRRAFIRIAGSSAVILAAGAGTFAMTRQPTKALEPWTLAGTVETKPRRRALSYAILAPNPHNRQPWMVELAGDDEIVLFCDPERRLPVTDPFNRQITIGLGCFLELLRMAAAEDGYRADITPFPDGYSDEALDNRPVARIRLSKTADRDPLFAAVPNRRSNKEPFDTSKPVSGKHAATISEAGSAVEGVTGHSDASEAMVASLRSLTWRGVETEMLTPAAHKESIDLMRIGKTEIEANPDGIDLGGAFLETLSLVGALDREQLADPSTTAFQQGIDMYKDITGTGMAYVWLVTPANTRLDQLKAGAAYLRQNLQATALGVDMHPLSQVLQEYAEMKALYVEMENLLKVPGGTRVQMLARLGYGPKVDPSPRWRADTRILNA